MRGLLLDLFTKSGKTDVFRGMKYSDKLKDIQSIYAPSFSLLGDATPDTFYKAMDDENVEEGFVGRFTIIECANEHRTPFNEAHGTIVPDNYLVDRLSTIVRTNSRLSQTNEIIPIQIQQTPDAYQAQMRFQKECEDRIYENRESPEAKIYSRAHMRLLRLAGLIAVGVSPDVPIVTPEIVDWARKFIVHGIAKVTWRFEHGEVGEQSSYLKQLNAVKNIIRTYWDKGFKETLENDGISRDMYDAKLITHKYINRRMMGYVAFQRTRSAGFDLKNILSELQRSSILHEINMGMIRESNRTGAAYYILDYNSLKHTD